ncbi:hypothetical protein BCR42DRAFT_421170 [Absidia repens]|uniref:RING-type domain-containing protein n=1 Tax=Absidia repens TaxID=90262 RepID=A0A1X2I850_9FUNG|nr:hypothetical protein BCR42DRAFT_421170 [Absidia repens]
MPLTLKRRFFKRKKQLSLFSSNEKDDTRALMPSSAQPLEDEQRVSHSIMVMCSPFHYKTKQYRHLRSLLIAYIEYIKSLLALVQHHAPPPSRQSNDCPENDDQVAHLCSMMHDQLGRIKHAFRKVSACRHDIELFCQDQYDLLEQNNWSRMEQTLTLLCATLPLENDYLCPICLSILTRPNVLNGCHHRFCQKCLEDFFIYGGAPTIKQANPSSIPLSSSSSSSSNIMTTTMTTMTTMTTTTTNTTATTTTSTNITRPDDDIVTGGVCFQCPVCRAPVTKEQIQVDQALSNFLALYFPPKKPWWKPMSRMLKHTLDTLYVAWRTTSSSYCCTSATLFPFDDAYVQGQIYMPAWY